MQELIFFLVVSLKISHMINNSLKIFFHNICCTKISITKDIKTQLIGGVTKEVNSSKVRKLTFAERNICFKAEFRTSLFLFK